MRCSGRRAKPSTQTAPAASRSANVRTLCGSIVGVDKAQRSLDQRLSLLRHGLHGLASPSAHGDPVADTINWDWPTAVAVIAGVSALAACRRPRP
jgi:hypothetical protein